MSKKYTEDFTDFNPFQGFQCTFSLVISSIHPFLGFFSLLSESLVQFHSSTVFDSRFSIS